MNRRFQLSGSVTLILASCLVLLGGCGGAAARRGTVGVRREEKVVYVTLPGIDIGRVTTLRLRGDDGRMYTLSRDDLRAAADGRLALDIPVSLDMGTVFFVLDDGSEQTFAFDEDDVDFDGDGVVDALDDDDDGDGTSDDEDTDDDGDGVSDEEDASADGDDDLGDSDGDGVSDDQDYDDDGDGISDDQDYDDDGDGISDDQDTDDGGDGISDDSDDDDSGSDDSDDDDSDDDGEGPDTEESEDSEDE